MSKNAFKVIVVLGIATLAGLSLLSTPASAQGGCATSNTHLSVSIASHGWPVGVFTDITDCSDRKHRYTVERTFTSACGVTTMISNGRVAFTPGQFVTVSTSWYVPSDACLGTGLVTATVSDGTELLSTSSAPLTIQ